MARLGILADGNISKFWMSKFLSFLSCFKGRHSSSSTHISTKKKMFSEEYLSEEKLVKLNNIHEKNEKMGSLVVVLSVAGCFCRGYMMLCGMTW